MMWRATGIAASMVLVACATMEDPSEDPIEGEETQALTGPTILKTGTSTAHVLSSSSTGPGLEIDGGKQLGSYLIAKYDGVRTSADVTADFTVTAEPGAAFVYSLRGSGLGYTGKHLRVDRVPNSTTLRTGTPNGNVNCGTLPSNDATLVTIALSTAAQRFDVLIDGAPTACTDLQTGIVGPIVGFEMMDASNDGYGGKVRFEGLAYP